LLVHIAPLAFLYLAILVKSLDRKFFALDPETSSG
jgi:hypothetical protein